MLAPLGMSETGIAHACDAGAARLDAPARGRRAADAARHGAARDAGGHPRAAAACTGRSATTCAFSGSGSTTARAACSKPETVAWAARDGLDGLKVKPSADRRPAHFRHHRLFPGPVEILGLFVSGQRRARADRPRRAGSLAWGGLGNLYFWIDRQNGVAGFWATQLFPFMDPTSLGGALAFETALYDSLRAVKRSRAR